VLIGSASPAAVALFAATRDIPIVMTAVGDPVALGLSGSMSRPTHNVTGFTISNLSLAAKRLELLHGTLPGLRKVAYLWVPENPLAALFESHVQKAADVLGISLVSLPLTSQADIPRVFAKADAERVSAVLVESDPLTLRYSANIADECLVRDLPGMHSWPVEARNGALMSYGPAEIENNARAAVYVDRVLKGTKVADLPFEEPSQFKLVVNLRTAHSIKVTLPPPVLARADEVIE
jgi:putative ABC transport system substrate-binding protein